MQIAVTMFVQLQKGLLVEITMIFVFGQTEEQHLSEDFEACLLCPANDNNNHNNNNNNEEDDNEEDDNKEDDNKEDNNEEDECGKL